MTLPLTRRRDETDEPRRVHPVDEVPPIPRLTVLGPQHLFIMYAGAVAVPLIVGPAIGLSSADIALLVSADPAGVWHCDDPVGRPVQHCRRAVARPCRCHLYRAEPDDHHRQPTRHTGRLQRSARRGRLRADYRETILDDDPVLPTPGGGHRFGHPKFVATAIISMCIVMLITYTESTADMLAVGEMVDRDLTPNDLALGPATDGLSAVLAGFMNSFPDTAFAENVGLVGLTKVRSRWVITTCGVFLVILGRIPKSGQVVADLPGHDALPKNFQTIFGSSITSTVIVVFVLKLVFNQWDAGREQQEGAVDIALEHDGAVAVDIPDGGVRRRDDDATDGDVRTHHSGAER